MEENKYSHSKVYKLVYQINNYFYIGSTTTELFKRLSRHRKCALQTPNTKLYRYMNTIGRENFKIVLISEHNLESRIQLIREEDIVIQKYINDEKCLNSNRSLLTEEEHKQSDRDRCKLYKARHKEHISEYNKTYRNNNIECIKERLKKNNQEKYTCVCGVELTTGAKYNHLKSKIHFQLMQNIL